MEGGRKGGRTHEFSLSVGVVLLDHTFVCGDCFHQLVSRLVELGEGPEEDLKEGRREEGREGGREGGEGGVSEWGVTVSTRRTRGGAGRGLEGGKEGGGREGREG